MAGFVNILVSKSLLFSLIRQILVYFWFCLIDPNSLSSV